MKLQLPIHNGEMFTYDTANKTIIAEASTLQGNTGRVSGQMYDDAADIGFVIKSHKTGKLAEFVHERDEISDDEDREFIAEWYAPTGDAILDNPTLVGWRVVVFND